MTTTVDFPDPFANLPTSVRVMHGADGFKVIGYWSSSSGNTIKQTRSRWEALLTTAAWKGADKIALLTLLEIGAETQISDVYDAQPEVANALCVLVPGFEYPDWSHLTMLEAMAVIAARRTVFQSSHPSNKPVSH